MKKLKPYSFQVSDPVFKTALYVIVNLSYEKMIIKLKKRFPDFCLKTNEDALGLSFEHYDEKSNLNYPFLWVKNFNWDIRSQETFTHELNHSIFAALIYKNMAHSENNEAHCYLFGYYFTECWRKLNKRYNN